jgi:hypothetical protein
MHLCEVQAVSSRNQARSFLRLSIAIHDYHAIFNDRQLIVRFVFDTFFHMLNRQRKQCTVYSVLALFGHLLTTALFHPLSSGLCRRHIKAEAADVLIPSMDLLL